MSVSTTVFDIKSSSSALPQPIAPVSPEVGLQVTESVGLLTSNAQTTSMTSCVSALEETALVHAIHQTILSHREDAATSGFTGCPDDLFASTRAPTLIGQHLEKLTPGQRYIVFVAPAGLGHGSLPSACYAVVTAIVNSGGVEKAYEVYITPDLSNQVELLLMQAVDAQLEVDRLQQPDGISTTPPSSCTTLNRFTEAASIDPSFVATVQSLVESQTAQMTLQLQHQQQEMDELKSLLKAQSMAAATEDEKQPESSAHGQYYFSYSSPVVGRAPNFEANNGDCFEAASLNACSVPSTADAWVEV